ncbi:MAG TPA: hypothetical protein VI027_15590 [Rubrobacteraceae bacterium]
MVVGRGREEAIHVLFFEARIIESARGGLPDQIERSEAGAHLPEVRLGHPNDSRASAQAHPSPVFATGTKTAAGSPDTNEIVADLSTGSIATLVAGVFVEVCLLDGGMGHHQSYWKYEAFVFRAST